MSSQPTQIRWSQTPRPDKAGERSVLSDDLKEFSRTFQLPSKTSGNALGMQKEALAETSSDKKTTSEDGKILEQDSQGPQKTTKTT
ncbi:hypothetical protein CLAFUW4_07836 [Fulvia fulva]|uniref:Uncharacterized protein n=1 Tax=Passalora fulva TaxID=5499 RepID=A0A9Q8LDM1_PASFU|nr:uncharacterized protein CLAFUR5_07960 [Fulvia fulva]KAK4629474.1 hypothetical protein CLAFUR4_07841 [Fulvia fulva]KAK4630414.1 hypothetical protein CLAFUR0_07838 [Fulvia fulva]UJO15445.1 hypothetical protein CLAFUR5_07960 [Fulvia fulva]WPV12201.1 hypothetical protein CLAFUW4_07836 [Fulvia fulva]WPV27574.1 hypothetical protein CLAFUW7_07837 [Fulvia fulva]